MDNPLAGVERAVKTPRGRQIMLGAAGLVVLLLLYRAYESRATGGTAASAAGASTPAPDGSADDGSDYASLSGQEQSDVAALQGQNSDLSSALSGLTAQESSDVGGLGAQETSDVGGINAAISALTDTVNGLVDDAGQVVGASPAATTHGQHGGQAHDPNDKRGRVKFGQGLHSPAFDKYYKAVTGKNPPAHIRAGNKVAQEYRHRVGITKAQHQKLGKLASTHGSHLPKPHMPVAGKAASPKAAHAVAHTAPVTPKPVAHPAIKKPPAHTTKVKGKK